MALAIDGGCLFQHLLEAPSGHAMRQLVQNILDRLSLSEVIHPPPSTTAEPPEPVLSKRQDALQELLYSERAYAADLTLILEVHIPLAQGPMTQEDIKLIFRNIGELAELSDTFCKTLERCMGSALDKADATDDRIGELFLEYAPGVEGAYKQYIMRHSSALAHLRSLPSTPELTAYHTQTHELTSSGSLSHAWDLAFLLIKPVQRLLKYSRLLDAVIEATSPTHPDHIHLVSARTAMEQVAHAVNEGRRRAEVVKEVLAALKKPPAVRRIPGKSFRAPADVNSDVVRVDRMEAELLRIEIFAQQLSRHAQEWARAAHGSAHALLSWARSLAAAIGLSTTETSDAFDAFLATVTEGILPIAASVLPNIVSDLLGPLTRLLATAAQPRQLLASMNEHAHYHLLTMPVSATNRPPPALRDASARYLALRTQLAAELPVYLSLLHRGLAALVRRLAAIQAAFFFDTREVWAGLWDMLRVECERIGGGEETVGVWRARWEEVDQGIQTLKICQALPVYTPRFDGWNEMSAAALWVVFPTA
ncbi:Dbl homology domain-containing protein [Mycena amicta]|nr:Dbl homology domain-containing protein [Mycena amicta]